MDMEQHLDRLGALLDAEREAEKDRYAQVPFPERVRRGLVAEVQSHTNDQAEGQKRETTPPQTIRWVLTCGFVQHDKSFAGCVDVHFRLSGRAANCRGRAPNNLIKPAPRNQRWVSGSTGSGKELRLCFQVNDA